jgi:putative transposase
MPRTRAGTEENGRANIFHKAHDYEAFLSILALAKAWHPVKMFAFSLMPNHFPFVVLASINH